MRRLATWGGAAVMGVLLLGAEPAPPALLTPRSMPPLPVPPVERGNQPPYLARMTVSGDPRLSGVFEECVDPAQLAARARARREARPADAPPPLTGCTATHQVQPGGSVRQEMSCDKAKGARSSFRIVSDGTPGDLHTHTERYGVAWAGGAPETIVTDSHYVNLGPCPAELKPGQMRRPNGTIIETGEAARLRDSARREAP